MNPAVAHVLQFFEYKHLPLHLQAVSRPFCELAHAMAKGDNCGESGTCTFGSPLPDNPEKTVALRKLLESKDAAVRTLLAVRTSGQMPEPTVPLDNLPYPGVAR